MTYLTYPDSVAVRHGACEEMYGLLHVIVVLELSRQMVARRPVAGLIRNGSRLRQTHQHFRSETWLPWYTAVLSGLLHSVFLVNRGKRNKNMSLGTIPLSMAAIDDGETSKGYTKQIGLRRKTNEYLRSRYFLRYTTVFRQKKNNQKQLIHTLLISH